MNHHFYFPVLVLTLVLSACQSENFSLADQGGSGTGTGGSLARFTIVGPYLYTLDTRHLSVFQLREDGVPVFRQKVAVSEGMETIFQLGEYLLLGARNGLYIYRMGTDGVPAFVSQYEHITACDPVVANSAYAFVTLSNTSCGLLNAPNQLDVVSLADISRPEIVASLPMDSPRGVGLDGSILFVCQEQFGLAVLDVSDPRDPKVITRIEGIYARDVITLGGLLLVIGPDNIFQYDYSGLPLITKVSEIPLGV